MLDFSEEGILTLAWTGYEMVIRLNQYSDNFIGVPPCHQGCTRHWKWIFDVEHLDRLEHVYK